MAEVEKVSALTTTVAKAADIPVGNGESGNIAGGTAVELGTSPTQERSSNSHHSEYDTASDLEGGEDYDDDDDLDDDDEDDGDSMTDDEDEDETDEEDDGHRGTSQDKADAEAQKKVDEDRSNPQYIPKRGTFYEHDDRTAEGEVDAAAAVEGVETNDSTSNNAVGGVSAVGIKSPQSPEISQASKTMKKWQPASGVDRWSHDRFDASEQAPKSRTELVTSYGYDIRTEEAPPRARRRRRYGRGPSKYSRNWEDENAYLKASNKERKPPRPGDFPALNERGPKNRSTPHGIRDEKENHMDRRPATGGVGGSVVEKNGGPKRRSPYPDERRERPEGREGRSGGGAGAGGKQKNFGRGTNAPVGRQAAMEFKQKQRGSNGQSHHAGASATASNNAQQQQNNRIDQSFERQSHRSHNSHSLPMNDQPKSSQKGGGSQPKNVQSLHQHDNYNNNGHAFQLQQNQQQHMQSPQQQAMSMRQALPNKSTPTSNLSQRLQQVQNRNDPSHVGSVQMHALATQNQLVGQQQQAASIILSPQQPQQLPPQEQRGPPKRYSSLRRSQHLTGEAQHLAEQHQLQQQLQHMQQQQQQQPLLLQEQHMLQANLMQLYHQENLQAQMQALQVSQSPTVVSAQQSKQPAYTTVPSTATQPPPQAYQGAPNATGTPTAYYVAATPDAYQAVTAAAAAATPQAAQYTQQAPPPNYLPQTQSVASATLAYTSAPPSAAVPQVVPPVVAPTTPYGAGPATVVPASAPGSVPQVAPATGANPNYPNYQNFNTVGGTTYFVPPPVQATARPVVLPQRRPTNAIPILPPSEKNKQRAAVAEAKAEETAKSSGVGAAATAPIGSAENIDHIIDNMFVQRPVFQPPQAAVTGQVRKSSTPLSADNSVGENSGTSVVTEDNVSSLGPTDNNAVNITDTAAPIESVSNVGVVAQE